MTSSRRQFLALVAASAAWPRSSARGAEGVRRYVRFERGGQTAYGLLEGETVRPLGGDLFASPEPQGEALALDDVKLLYPCEPTKILAMAGNYRDHLAPDAEVPANPEIFYKPVSSLLSPGEPIVLPPGARDVHYEAEFVVVMGKKAKDVSVEEAEACIFGYTCGNDISERNWQNGSLDGPENKDLQWWRAKGSETFSPLGPAIAVGLDWEEAAIELRLNDEVRQKANLSSLIHKPAETISFVSRYVTLLPGDVLYTGTSGRTSRISSGDTVEVEVEGIGTLRNPVA